MDADARNVMRLIDKHSGEWTWYQLARCNIGVELAQNGINLMRVLESLAASRYIVETNGPNPSQPFYVITQLGRETLAQENTFPST
jgi:hypothetical protein